MGALLPVAVLVLLAMAFHRWSAARATEWDSREAILAAATGAGVVAVAGAEILGALHALAPAGVAGIWLAAGAVAVAVLLRIPAPVATDRGAAGGTAGERLLRFGLAALAAVVAVLAFAAPPNNWDSLTYHLPRVSHWIQDRSLAPYPTSIPRQLTLPPGAEILLTHLRLLSGSDRTLPLLQWAAWVGGFAAASAVAGRLGAGRVGQLAAAAFAATLPMAILQASSTQNDLVAAFWLLTFVLFALRAATAPRPMPDALVAGSSLGLALLTKATAYVFAFPFVLWLGAAMIRRSRGRAAAPLLAAGGIAVAVNLGYFLRNVAVFGSIFGLSYGARSEISSPAALASGALRNAALHFATPSAAWNRALEAGVVKLHGPLGIGPSDARTTWRGAEFHVPPGLQGSARPDPDEVLFLLLHEDHAGNPIHFLLIAAAAVAAAVSRRRNPPEQALYFASLAAAALLFCAVLKWQPWNARLQLPLFLLAAPAVAATLASESRPAWSLRAGAILLLIAAPWALLNATRPLLGPESVFRVPRIDQSFAARPDLKAPLLQAAGAISGRRCSRVGLEIGPDDPEYLLWLLLGRDGPKPRIEHLAVANASSGLARREPFASFRPCAILALEAPGSAPAPGAVFTQEWPGGRVTVRPP
jgi:hypothetical protein